MWETLFQAKEEGKMAAQIVAVVIFVLMFVLLVTEKIERHIVTMACGIATVIGVFIICMKNWTIAWEVISLESFIQPHFWFATGEATTSVGINWETICFIVIWRPVPLKDLSSNI